MPSRKRLGIAHKLFIAFTVVAIIPLAAALAVSVTVLMSQAKIVASEVLWGKVRLAKLYYDERCDNMARTLDAASRNTGILVNMALSLDSAVAGSLAEISEAQNLDGLWVFTPEDRLFASANDLFPFSDSVSDAAFQHPTGQDPVFSILEQKNGFTFLLGSMTLVSGTGETVGYLRAVIDLTRFCAEATDSVKTPVFIILDSGRKLYVPELGKNGSSTMILAETETLQDTSGYSVQNEAKIDGVPYLISVIPVVEPMQYSIRLGVAYPKSLIAGPRNRELALLAVTSAFAVLLASLGGAYFRKKIIVPVLAVAEAARTIAGGVYGNTVDIGARDEIGALASDFNRMSERLYAQGKEREEAERVIEESLVEKETLLREIHHRVKNNFQIINSLFDLQLMNTEDVAVQESLSEPKARIHAMALIHDRLYQSESLSSIDFGDYVGELSRDLFYSYNVDPSRIFLDIDADSISLDMDRAIPCGLMLNELMTNALKYAFPDTAEKGRITVTLKKTVSAITLRVKDDGTGFAPDTITRSKGTLGLTLVHILCDQIKGSFTLETEKGVTATICFQI